MLGDLFWFVDKSVQGIDRVLVGGEPLLGAIGLVLGRVRAGALVVRGLASGGLSHDLRRPVSGLDCWFCGAHVRSRVWLARVRNDRAWIKGGSCMGVGQWHGCYWGPKGVSSGSSLELVRLGARMGSIGVASEGSGSRVGVVLQACERG